MATETAPKSAPAVGPSVTLHILRGRATHNTRQMTGPTLLIGSGSLCDVQMRSPEVAPKHCLLTRGPQGVRVDALDPQYPLAVDGRRCESADLGDGATLTIGPFELRVDVAGDPPPTPAPASAAAVPTVRRESPQPEDAGGVLGSLLRSPGRADRELRELEALDRQLRDRKEQLATTSRTLEEREAELRRREDAVRQAVEQLEQRRLSLTDRVLEHDRSQEEFQGRRRQLDRVRQKFADRFRHRNALLEADRAETRRLREQLDLRQREAAEAEELGRQRLAELDAGQRSLETQAANLAAQIEQFHQERERAEQFAASLAERESRLAEDDQRLHSEHAELRRQLAGNEQRKAELEQACDASREEAAALAQRREELERRLEEFAAERSRVEEAGATLEQRERAIAVRIAELETRVQQSAERAAELDRREQTLQVRQRSADQTARLLQEREHELREQGRRPQPAAEEPSRPAGRFGGATIVSVPSASPQRPPKAEPTAIVPEPSGIDATIRMLLITQLVDRDAVAGATRQAEVRGTGVGQELVAAGKLTAYQWRTVQAGRASTLRLGPARVLDVVDEDPVETVYKVALPNRDRPLRLRLLAASLCGDDQRRESYRRSADLAASRPHDRLETCLGFFQAVGRFGALYEENAATPLEMSAARPVSTLFRWLESALTAVAHTQQAGRELLLQGPPDILTDADDGLLLLGWAEPDWLRQLRRSGRAGETGTAAVCRSLLPAAESATGPADDIARLADFLRTATGPAADACEELHRTFAERRRPILAA